MKAGYDLSRLIKFATREDWRDALEEALGDHFGAAMEEFGLESEEIGEVLGDHYAGVLFGCALEDLMTRRFESDAANLVDDYLKRRGWNETAPAKAYMRSLRDSACSLYEVSGIVPGASFLARDLVRGGEPVLITERTASHTLRQWDRITARIVPERKGHILSGALLPFSPDGAERLLDGLRSAEGKRRKSGYLDIDHEVLASIAHLFTTGWLFDVLPQALGLQAPAIQNSDGDELEFHNVRFPFSKGTTAEAIAALLAADPEMHRENASFWNWLKPSSGTIPLAKRPGALAFGTSTDDGRMVFGNLEFKGRTLVLSVNSANRATQGTAALAKLLGAAVGKPLTEIETIEQAAQNRKGPPPPEPVIPPEMATELIHGVLDKHYRETLDQPVEMLGNLTPHEATQSAQGRKKLVEWLKLIENRSAQHPNDGDPMATYDFSWIWAELGIEKLRK